MAGLQTPAALAALKTTLYKDFQEAMRETPVRTADIFTRVASSTLLNTYAFMAALPHMREWVGERHIEGLKERIYQIENKDYERTIGIQKNDLDDGNVANVQLIMQGLSTAAVKLQDDLGVSLLQNGTSGLAFDGQNFFDTDHPTDIDNGTGTQSNNLTGTALTAANYQTARSTMMSYLGENGKPLMVRPNLLVVPPQLEKDALDIVKASTIATGGTNVQAGTAEVQVWEQLSNEGTTWYMFDTTSPGPKALIYQERQAPRMLSKTDASEDKVFYNKEYVFGVDARVGAGYGMWFKALRAIA